MFHKIKYWLIAIFLLFVYNSNAEWMIYNTQNSVLPDNVIYDLSLDKHGVVWAGTDYCDIVKTSVNNWSVIPRDSVQLYQLHKLHVGLLDDLWICGVGGISKIVNNIRIKKNEGNSNLKGAFSSVFEIDSLSMFAGSDQALYRLLRSDLSIIQTFDTSNSPLRGYITTIIKDSSANYWFGTGYGLVKYNGTNWSLFNTLNSGLPDNEIHSLLTDHLGNIWIGTENKGVCKYDGTNWINYNRQNSPITGSRILDIKQDSAGNIWMAGNGVSKLHDTTWTTYTTSNSSLPDFSVYAICIDNYNNKWFATNNGLAVFNETGIVYTSVQNNEIPVPKINGFPNPSGGSLNLDYTLAQPSNVDISLYTQDGKFIRQYFQMNEDSGSKHIVLDISGLTQGTYYLLLKIDGKVSLNKIIKID